MSIVALLLFLMQPLSLVLSHAPSLEHGTVQPFHAYPLQSDFLSPHLVLDFTVSHNKYPQLQDCWRRQGSRNSKGPKRSQPTGNMVVSRVSPVPSLSTNPRVYVRLAVRALSSPAAPQAVFHWIVYSVISCESRTTDGSTTIWLICSLPL